MSFLKACGVCCMCLSIWAIIQLSLMGFFYYIETPILIDDVHAKQYTNFSDYMHKTRDNYRQNALNCWAVAGVYFLTCLISITCIHTENSKENKAAKKFEDDELTCGTIMMEPMVKKEEKKTQGDKAFQKRMEKMQKQTGKKTTQPGRQSVRKPPQVKKTYT